MSIADPPKVAKPDLGSTAYRHGADWVPPALGQANYFRLDPNMALRLRLYLGTEERDWAFRLLDEFGALCGGAIAELSTLANRHTPELRQFDERGARIDQILFHPSYTEMC
ncbi:MAG: hypothetical protein O7A68_04345, partial [Alphaproteobacteria bacterium]|nr:hypothetical protein [Alphaproteobacteria bacterium]